MEKKMRATYRKPDGSIGLCEPFAKHYSYISQKAANYTARKKEMDEQIREEMEEYGLSVLENDIVAFNLGKANIRYITDETMLKALYPKVYDETRKMVTAKGSLRAKIKVVIDE